jgi:general stress protein YciG
MQKNALHQEISKRGGEQTKKRNGINFYKKIGKKGGQATRDRYNSTYFRRIGRLGGLQRHNKE